MRGVVKYPVYVFVVVCVQRTIAAVEPLCRNSLFNGDLGHIPDSAFSSSNIQFPVSPRDDLYQARARMGTVLDTDEITAWRTETLDRDQFVQVDLGRASFIQSIRTAGCGSSITIKSCKEYVTKYRVQHSLDGNTWSAVKEGGTDKIFSGNTDPYGIVSNELECPVLARFVQIIPHEWHNWITLKFDVHGCTIPTGMSTGLYQIPTELPPVADTGAIPSSHFTLSSNRRSSAVKGCIGGLGNLSCHGIPDGDYQHCVSCKKFINCSRNVLTELTCTSYLVWDNRIKQCITESSTCR